MTTDRASLLSRQSALIHSLQGEWKPIRGWSTIVRRTLRSSLGILIVLTLSVVGALISTGLRGKTSPDLSPGKVVLILLGTLAVGAAACFLLMLGFGLYFMRRPPIRVVGDDLVVEKGKGFVRERLVLSCLLEVYEVKQQGLIVYGFRTSRFMNTPQLMFHWFEAGDRLLALLRELAEINRELAATPDAS